MMSHKPVKTDNSARLTETMAIAVMVTVTVSKTYGIVVEVAVD